MNDIKPDRARLEGRERVLAQGLWDVWAALGNDTDGDTGPWAWISGSGVENFCRNVLNDAREYRAETEAEVDRQYHEAQTAEAEVARLTTLLEQRTAALTRTIDAKNTAEAQIARVEALIPRDPELIDAGYAVPAEDLILALDVHRATESKGDA